MKKLFTLLLTVGIGFSAFATIDTVTIDSIQFINGSDLSAGNDESYRDGDTVVVSGLVTMNPCLYGLSSGPNRVGTFIQDTNANAWGGLHVLIDDGALSGFSGTLNDLDVASDFTNNFTVGNYVTCTGIVGGFAGYTQLNLIDVPSTGTFFGAAKDTQVVTLDMFIDGAGTQQYTTGEQYEGLYVEFQNVTIVDVDTSSSSTRQFWSIQQGSNKIPIRDVSGWFRNDDQDRYCTGSSETSGAGEWFTPPPSGTTLEWIRGVIVEASAGGYSGYYLAPIDWNDLGPSIGAKPIADNFSIDPIQPTSADAVIVSAEITDIDGTVTSAELYYSVGVGNTTFTMVPMINSAGDTWEGIVPAQADDAIVNFWIKAFDNDGNYSNNPDSLATGSFYWVLDNGVTEIRQLQWTPSNDGNSVWDGDSLTSMNITGIVTATAESYDLGIACIQDGTDPYDGIFVWGDATFDWKRGDEVTITAGVVLERFNVTQLDNITHTVNSSGNPLPAFVQNVNIDSMLAGKYDFNEPYEGMLLEFIDHFAVDTNADAPSNFGEWEIHPNMGAAQGLRIDDYSDDFPFDFNIDSVNIDDQFGFVRGVYYFSFGNYKLLPRNLNDIDGFKTNYPKQITSFSFSLSDTTVFGSIDQNNGTIDISVPMGTDVTALTPDIDFDGEEVSPSGAQDFTSTVTYTVTAPVDASTKDYDVTVDFFSVGVNEIHTLDALNIYPNPATDQVKVNMTVSGSETVVISLYDVLGARIQSKVVRTAAGNNQIAFDTQALETGIYLIEVDGQSFKTTQKVSIIH